MNNFVFHNSTKVVFGKGTVGAIGDEIKNYGYKKVLFLYGGGSIKKNGVYDSVVDSLRRNSIEFVEVSGVKPNPVLSKVKEAIDVAKRENVEAILAVGGGSVIDSAKTIAAGFYYDGDIWDAFTGKYKVKKSLPIFVVLTISATGSEMNGGAVITNEDTKEKWSFWASTSFPKASIIDPTVQFSLPREQTVYGGVDAIVHVLEYYFDGSKGRKVMDRIMESIIKTIMEAIEILIDNPTNYEWRANLAWSATLALNGLTSVGSYGGDWSSHIIEHSLSALYDIAHGAGLAIVTPAWMRYVMNEDREKFERFAKEIFGKNNAEEGIEAFKGWLKKVGAPVSLKDVGISFEDVGKIAENAAIRSPFGKLKPLYKEDIIAILKLAFE
ncbi:MAG: iron-containing alcohol dehydrogenase [Thermotogaceae bacterium]|nr:iron-containing alcohol dehydrogenase [Thermotogaceae bacterium]